jgi:hypothetical protein
MDAFPPLPPEIWDQTPPVAQEMILAQAAALAQLRVEITQLKATVEELAQRLGRNSHNSSQPPSADPPQTSKRSRRDPQWASTRWAAWPRGAHAGADPGGGGGGGDRGQARAVPPLPAPAGG